MYSMRRSNRLALRLKVDPIQFKMISDKKPNVNKYVSFITGSLLIVSETLPFFENFHGNGVLHTLRGGDSKKCCKHYD